MKQKIKIAYCLPSLYIAGGMERVLTIKANYFADVLGYDVYIILTDEKGKKPYYHLSSKITIINLDIDFNELWNKPLYKKMYIYLKKQQKYKVKLRNCLMEIKPDITVSMLRREINFISQIKDGSIKIGEIHVNRENFREISEKKETSIHKLLSNLWMKQLIKKLKRLDKFVVLTHEDAEKWNELTNTIVIPNPLPFFPDKQSSTEHKKVIAVGRYTWQKGFDLLIDCWHLVHKKHPDWTLHIYGEGERDKLQAQIDKLELNNSCILEHAVPDIINKYIDNSIFVLSSRYEGFGMVIIEAMSCGVPPVSFTCPSGPRDIIKHGEDGLLVKNGDVELLANSIIYLIEHNDIRKNMGEKARMNVERYKIDQIAQEWNNLFLSLIAKKGK
ncbi:glycosyltransferase family 4 protein [Bacteroides sp. 224]|uniref:glycosyltransferase family 4 protein n=1 Tax=Bacteroides sp. 224 TaxID=2302936 RepID=UPI0013D6BA36|nr:glycosyltransferase family 4 protein [Bacteroides sp. 224]NDV65191.1 glycosyltransferase family 4 protein [Bacteroides sp. 224]